MQFEIYAEIARLLATEKIKQKIRPDFCSHKSQGRNAIHSHNRAKVILPKAKEKYQAKVYLEGIKDFKILCTHMLMAPTRYKISTPPTTKAGNNTLKMKV